MKSEETQLVIRQFAMYNNKQLVLLIALADWLKASEK